MLSDKKNSLGSSCGPLRSGMQPLLQYIDSHYKNPIIYITENGCDVPGESQMELQESLNDTFRINYYQVSAAVILAISMIGCFTRRTQLPGSA